MNEADSRRLAEGLEQLGLSPTTQARAADVLVMNTCVVRQQAEDKVYKRLAFVEALKRRNPGRIVALMGCLVGRSDDNHWRERFPFVDVILQPSEPEPLIRFMERRLTASAEFPEKTAADRPVTAFVPAVLGCSHACAFCIVPYKRGPEHSRPMRDILDEIRYRVDQGAREVTLLGQIVDRYGLDLPEPTDLASLLRAAGDVPGLHRVRFLTSHPKWMTDDILDAVRDHRVLCPQLEVPVQSGNDEVLARMRRGYTADDYRRLVDRIRVRLPHAALHTDIIVGFPGESEDQFMDTYRLLDEIEPDMVRLATYSPRPGTYAERHMPDDIPGEEKQRRWHMLNERFKAQLEQRHKAWMGREVEVLVESTGQARQWSGRTPEGKPVFFDGGEALIGRLARVRIEWTGPFSLVGRCVCRSEK